MMALASDERAHADWIAEQVRHLLDCFDAPSFGFNRTLSRDDWVAGLSRFSREAITYACATYRAQERGRVPELSDIAARARAFEKERAGPVPRPLGVKPGCGDRSKLSFDERRILEDEVLPRARSWLDVPGLADQGRRTLLFWVETF